MVSLMLGQCAISNISIYRRYTRGCFSTTIDALGFQQTLTWVCWVVYSSTGISLLKDIFLKSVNALVYFIPIRFSIQNPYTPCGRFTTRFPQRESDFQIDWCVEQLYLNFVPPLCIILIQSTIRVVHISCYGNVKWAIPLEMNTPWCLKGFG